MTTILRNIYVVISLYLVFISWICNATEYIWTGVSSTDISDVANWTPIPSEGFNFMTDNLIFPSGVTVTNLTNTSLQQVLSLTFQSGSPSYTLSGANFKFANIYNESDSNQIINNNLDWQQFSRTYSNNGSGTLTLGRILSTKPGKPLVTMTFNAVGNIIVSDGMTADGTPFDLIKNGSGTLAIQNLYDYKLGTNYNCTIKVNGGILDLTNMDINFEADNSSTSVDWDSLSEDKYTLIDYSNGSIIVSGANIFRSVSGLENSNFVMENDIESQEVYIYIPPSGTVITIK